MPRFLELCDLEIWWMTFKNNRAPLLCYFKLCASFHSHWWIQTGVKSPETPNLGQMLRFLEPCDLEIWRMTLKDNRAPLLSIIKLYASFHHMWIQTRVTVQKRLGWVLTSVTLTFDLWPWPFAWTSLLSLVITPENFMMMRWWEHGEKGVTDGQTDGLNQSYSCSVAAKNGPLLSLGEGTNVPSCFSPRKNKVKIIYQSLRFVLYVRHLNISYMYAINGVACIWLNHSSLSGLEDIFVTHLIIIKS